MKNRGDSGTSTTPTTTIVLNCLKYPGGGGGIVLDCGCALNRSTTVAFRVNQDTSDTSIDPYSSQMQYDCTTVMSWRY